MNTYRRAGGRLAEAMSKRSVDPPDVEAVSWTQRLDDHPDWAACFVFAKVDGDVALAEITLSHVGPEPNSKRELEWTAVKTSYAGPLNPPTGGGLTTQVLRSIKWGGLVRGARDAIAELYEDASFDRALPSWPTPPRAGRSTPADVELECALIAARYVELTGEKRLTPRIAAERGLSPKAISNRLERARQLGLLTRPGKTRAGGTLTDKAKEILSGLD